MKKISILIFISLGLITLVRAQQQSPLFSTYIFDPFIYNPAYITSSGYSEVNLVHRRQWVEINNAPVVSGLNAQFAFNPRISAGLTIINDESILLNNTTALGTFGYKVPLGKNNHFLSFGLSIGVFYNQLNINELDEINDPALLNAQNNNSDISGKFGINYKIKNLELGFALTNLFATDPFQASNFDDVSFSELNNQIASASYTFHVSSIIQVKPFGLYRFYEDGINYFEAGALVGYKDIFKIGSFYRQEADLGLLMQISPNDKFSISYAYDFGGNQGLSFGGSTHEFQLKLRLSKKTHLISTKDRVQKIQERPNQIAKKEDPIVEDTDVVPTNTDIVQTNTVPEREKVGKEETVLSPYIEENEPETDNFEQHNQVNEDQGVEDEAISMAPAYYLVVGSFEKETNARDFFRRIRKTYPKSELGFNPSTKYYFVYLYKALESQHNMTVIQKIRTETEFKDAWFMKIKN